MSACECGCGAPAPIAVKTDRRRGHSRGHPIRFVSGHNNRGRNRGALNPLWKGSDAGYMALHNWIRRHKPKSGSCSDCGAEGRTDWANVSGEYRRDLDDYRELCRPCHRRFDGVQLRASGH